MQKKPKREKVNREKKSKEYSGIKWSSKNFAITRNLYNNCFILCSRANNNISQETRKLANSIQFHKKFLRQPSAVSIIISNTI